MSEHAFLWGVLVAIGWGGLNLWCLWQLLRECLGPTVSWRRTIPWLIVKFPLVYAVAAWLLTRPGVSSLGFGVGFSLVLVVAIIVSLSRSIRMLRPHPTYGR